MSKPRTEPAVVLAALAALKAAYFSRYLVYPDLAWDYPFPGGDGLEWLSHGLWLGGADVACSGRQPLLPALIALFDRAGLLRWLPLVGQLGGVLLVLAAYRLVRVNHSASVAFLCGLFVLVLHAPTLMSLEIMADLAAVVLLTWALAGWLGDGGARRRWGTVAGAASGLAQSAAPLFLAPVLAWRAAGERPRWRWALPLALILLPPLAWSAGLAAFTSCSPLIARAQAFLLRPHLDSIDDYALLGLSFFGWPALALALGGGVIAARSPEGRRRLVPAVLYLGSVAALFVLLYDVRFLRLVLYALPGFVLLLAEAFRAMAGRRGLVAASAAVCCSAALWPQASLGDPRWLVWPAPLVEVVATIDGLGSAPARGQLTRGSWRDGFDRWAPRVVARRWRERRTTAAPVLTPDAARIDSAILLPPEGWDAGERFATQLRWSVALRRRVRWAPRAIYPPEWAGWSENRPVGRHGDFELRRWEPKSGSGAAILVLVPAGGRGVGAAPAPVAEELWRQEVFAAAPGIDRALDGDDGILAVVRRSPRDDAWVRWVPFAVRTSNVFVLSAAEAEGVTIEAEPGAPIGPFVARRGRFRGRPILRLELAAP